MAIEQARNQVSRPKQSPPYSVILANVVVLTAFAIRVWALDAKGLAYDEAATALMSRASIPEIVWFHWDAAFEHLPLWIMLTQVWTRLAGQSVVALRYLPALAGVLTVPLVWALLKKSHPADLPWRTLTSALVALSPVLILYAQEARMYTLVVLLGIASVYLLMECIGRSRWQPAVAFVLVNWAMLGLQYYSVLLLVAEAAFVCIAIITLYRPVHRSAASSQRTRIGITLGGLAVSVAPLVLWMAFAPGFRETLEVVLSESSKQSVPLLTFGADLWRDLSFGAIRWQPQMAVAGYLIIPIFLFGAISAFWPQEADGSSSGSNVSLWPLLFLLVVIMPIAISALMFRTLAARYILYVLPFVYAFIAYGIIHLWRRSRPAGAAAGIVTLAVAAGGMMYYFGPYVKSEYREMARYLEQRYEPDRHSVLIEAPRQHLLAKYYLGQDFPLQPVPDMALPDYWPLTAPRVVPEAVDDIVQGYLQDSAVVWLVLSAEAEVDPGEFLIKYLTAVAYKDGCRDWLDVRLCEFTSPGSVDFQIASDTVVTFGEELVLERAALSLPGDSDVNTTALLRMKLDWWAQQAPSVDYKLSVRLVGDDGASVSQADQYPIGTLLPPTTWAPGDRKPGYTVLTIPADLTPGRYSIQAEVYDPQTLLPVAHRTGDAVASDEALVLGVLEIGDTMRLRSAGKTESR